MTPLIRRSTTAAQPKKREGQEGATARSPILHSDGSAVTFGLLTTETKEIDRGQSHVFLPYEADKIRVA